MIILCLKKLLRFCGSRLNCTAQPFIQKKTTRYLVRRSAVHVAKTRYKYCLENIWSEVRLYKEKNHKTKNKTKIEANPDDAITVC